MSINCYSDQALNLHLIALIPLYTGCSDVFKFDAIYGSISGCHVVDHGCKCPYEIPRTEWTGNSAAPQDGVDNMTLLSSYVYEMYETEFHLRLSYDSF